MLRGHAKEGSRLYAALHPDDYVRKSLLANVEILEKRQAFARGMDQTLWVARKPARAEAKAQRLRRCRRRIASSGERSQQLELLARFRSLALVEWLRCLRVA